MLYLMRHGETDWNRQNRIQGQQNVGLNDTGIRQIDKAANWLFQNSITLQRIVSSPLQRAEQSALIIAEKQGVSAEFDARLGERSFGELEGLTLDEIATKFNIFDTEDVRSSVYGIESLPELQHRVFQVVKTLSVLRTENVLLVTHGSIIRALTGVTEIVKNGIILPYRNFS